MSARGRGTGRGAHCLPRVRLRAAAWGLRGVLSWPGLGCGGHRPGGIPGSGEGAAFAVGGVFAEEGRAARLRTWEVRGVLLGPRGVPSLLLTSFSRKKAIVLARSGKSAPSAAVASCPHLRGALL